MPLFDYFCDDCKNVEEIFSQKTLTDEDEKECPKCKSKKFKRAWTGNGYKTSFGLKSWRDGLSVSQQSSALLERGTMDGKREI